MPGRHLTNSNFDGFTGLHLSKHGQWEEVSLVVSSDSVTQSVGHIREVRDSCQTVSLLILFSGLLCFPNDITHSFSHVMTRPLAKFSK